eukprot:TRINITY_DN9772_c0_g1_i3.p3 TRINITY_DN9772_c0_g1~~TRINITY_DN9772_c0_g1_i3.p3  ORF type:complete len:103 (+),score=18.77 TRINITY_DN9772_c0_g1_i3:106-414(+)
MEMNQTRMMTMLCVFGVLCIAFMSYGAPSLNSQGAQEQDAQLQTRLEELNRRESDLQAHRERLAAAEAQMEKAYVSQDCANAPRVKMAWREMLVIVAERTEP